MPIYTLKCSSCGHVFEDLLSISAENPPCPALLTGDLGTLAHTCGQPTMKIPSQVSRPLGGDTPLHYRNRKENR
jgi:hypothetical protein